MGHGKKAIGSTVFSASNTGTFFGCGYKTPLELFQRFQGEAAEEISEESKKSMAFGSWFEDAVARYYAEQQSWKIKRCGETAYWSDDMPYFICHPDRLVIGQRIALEIKCVSPFAEGWGEEGTEEIPDVYYLQVPSYYACKVPCDLVIVVCMKGNRIYSYPIMKDEEVVAEIRKRVAEAYDSFNKGIVPKSENYNDANKYYGRHHNDEAEGIGANDEIIRLYDILISLHNQQDKLKNREEEIKKDLITSLGEAPAFLATENGKVKKIAYWSQTSRTSFDFDSLKADHPEIDLDKYRTSTQTPTFRVAYPRSR